MMKETIYLALVRKLGREPTPAELKANVQRIIAEGAMIGRSGHYKADSASYRSAMIDAGRGRLVR